MAWVDNLRTFVIVLVVNMHACVTYSHVGDWYVMEAPEPPMTVKMGFLFWQGHLQAFFMGLLFFLSGVFAHKSLERRGARWFLQERAVRLCMPALLYMLLIHPIILFVILGRNGAVLLWRNYLNYLMSGRFFSGNGPLWFALALFAFSMALVLSRWTPGRSPKHSQNSLAPTAAKLVLFGFGLVLGTFLVRLFQPIGTSILNFQLCFFVQYIAAFVAGIAAAKHGWLEQLAISRRAKIAGWLGAVLGPVCLLSVLQLGGEPPEHGPNPYAGGWRPQAFDLAFWEQLTGVALGLGMLALFRRHFNLSGPFAQWLNQRSFAVYVLHAPVLVMLTLWLRPIPGTSLSRMLVLTLLGLLTSYLAAGLAKRVPGLRSIL